jgi:hypothetical protein
MCGDKPECPRAIYLVKRGPRPSYAKASWHPVIVASRKHTAEWEAGWTGDGAWVWEHNKREGGSGWLLCRWAGLDINYGHIVRGCVLPDGTKAGIEHDRTKEPWRLLAGAVWWSDEPIPAWLREAGVVVAADEFTKERIDKDDGVCMLPASRQRALEASRDRRRGIGA